MSSRLKRLEAQAEKIDRNALARYVRGGLPDNSVSQLTTYLLACYNHLTRLERLVALDVWPEEDNE